MKNIYALVGILLLPTIILGQKVPVCGESRIGSLNRTIGIHAYDEVETDCDPKSNRIAIKQIETLAKLTGFPLRFNVCKGIKINNAYAAIDTLGNRFIVYDDAFLKNLDSDSLRMESLAVLAHEIGHHLASHTIAFVDESYRAETRVYCDQLSEQYDLRKCTDLTSAYLLQRREYELEADRIAGYIMFKYGATLDQISNMYAQIAWNKDDTHDAHPSLGKRIAAASAGYQLGANRQDAKVSIAELRGTKFDFVIKKLDVIERNQFRERIRRTLSSDAMQEAGRSAKYRCIGTSIGFDETIHANVQKYLGIHDYQYNINTDSEYFYLNAEACAVWDDMRIKFPLVIGAHIKNKEFRVIHFTDRGHRVLYKSNAIESEIGYEEVITIIAEMYRKGLQKEIDRFDQL